MNNDKDKEPQLVDEERVYTRHYVRWWERWFNPTTAMAIFGAIVWGIQLNFAVIQNTKDLGKAEALNREMTAIIQTVSQQQVRLSVVQGQAIERLRRLEDRVHIHDGKSNPHTIAP
jgi:hypothetical protein